mmetsp:Transcript_28586/g.65935  ORF Transcript_28586/g.65935 Transcript_28586/m.65935 type:complete len:158 (+) Transcript_28586:46-519(+)
MFRKNAQRSPQEQPDTSFASEVSGMIRRKLTQTSAGMPGSLLPSERKRGGVPSSHYYLDNILGLTPPEPAAIEEAWVGDSIYANAKTAEGGRKDYLRRRSRRPVQERYATPVTENMTYGFYPPKQRARSVQDSPRKSSMEQVFFRKRGIQIKMDGIM